MPAKYWRGRGCKIRNFFRRKTHYFCGTQVLSDEPKDKHPQIMKAAHTQGRNGKFTNGDGLTLEKKDDQG